MHFVVATKFFRQNIFYHHVDARAKNFWRARIPTVRNLDQKMLKKRFMRFFTKISKSWIARAPKIFRARINMMLKKIFGEKILLLRQKCNNPSLF